MADRIRPLDVWHCNWCGQDIAFDADMRSDPALDANCEGICDWELVSRAWEPEELIE